MNLVTFAQIFLVGVLQLQSGRIVGSVLDPQKAGIPGATVTITNLATNLTRTVVTEQMIRSEPPRLRPVPATQVRGDVAPAIPA